MSSLYLKIETQFEPPTMYGYKRVTPHELNGIVGRLTRPTCNSRFSAYDSKAPVNYQQVMKNRPISACIKWTDSPLLPIKYLLRRSDKDIDRITRRVRKQTASSYFKSADESDELAAKNDNFDKQINVVVSGENAAGFLRPTTASLSKIVGKNGRKRRPRSAPTTEAPRKPHNFDRVTADTVSSAQKPCKREWKSELDPIMMQSPLLPLISGLERSNNVQEIVHRLHGSQRKTPQCTEVVYMH